MAKAQQAPEAGDKVEILKDDVHNGSWGTVEAVLESGNLQVSFTHTTEIMEYDPDEVVLLSNLDI